jgi:hypothetical protein
MNAEPNVPLCTHIKTNGRPCQSPALAGEPLCFFHNQLRVTHRRPPIVEALTSFWQETGILNEGDPEGDPGTIARVYPRQNEIEFPPLEDAESVQLATSMLFQAIATGQIYFKRARLLLYTLKIAVINQRALTQSRAADAASPSTLPPPADHNHQPMIRHPERSAADAAAPPDDDAPIQPRPAAPASASRPVLSFRSAAEESASLSHAPVNSPTAAPSAASHPAPHPPQPTPDVPVSEIPASDVPVSEIGRDFSPGTTAAESMRAFSPWDTPLPTFRARPAFFSTLCSSVRRLRPAVPVPCSLSGSPASGLGSLG